MSSESVYHPAAEIVAIALRKICKVANSRKYAKLLEECKSFLDELHLIIPAAGTAGGKRLLVYGRSDVGSTADLAARAAGSGHAAGPASRRPSTDGRQPAPPAAPAPTAPAADAVGAAELPDAATAAAAAPAEGAAPQAAAPSGSEGAAAEPAPSEAQPPADEPPPAVPEPAAVAAPEPPAAAKPPPVVAAPEPELPELVARSETALPDPVCDRVIGIFRLAIDTQRPEVIEVALDCIQKLVAFRFLQGAVYAVNADRSAASKEGGDDAGDPQAAAAAEAGARKPQVKNKMSKAGFLKNNRGINDGVDLPEDFMASLYERIVNNEIKMKDEAGAAAAAANEGGGLAAPARALFNTLLGLMGGRGQAVTAGPSDAAIKATLDYLHQRAASATTVTVTEAEAVRPLMEVIWAPLLGALSTLYDEFNDPRAVNICLAGFTAACCLTAQAWLVRDEKAATARPSLGAGGPLGAEASAAGSDCWLPAPTSSPAAAAADKASPAKGRRAGGGSGVSAARVLAAQAAEVSSSPPPAAPQAAGGQGAGQAARAGSAAAPAARGAQAGDAAAAAAGAPGGAADAGAIADPAAGAGAGGDGHGAGGGGGGVDSGVMAQLAAARQLAADSMAAAMAATSAAAAIGSRSSG
ncbi:Protein transport protein sec72 [Tetrabaena socialis]|uniref:Protein transport protein sec72 n=1 Tax=Tetrabaena socialis TaxID=47790 RepID=A0A2J7ZNM1_9CHLO|nr:Protein transport protein sec72 [Tetrabaena socialis]|eukprot:PNH01848.1 Protein transport protein sec72 [Tetrabaena socialis]